MTRPHKVGVYIAVPTRGEVRIEWAVSFGGLAAPTHITQMLGIIPGRGVEEARNVAAQKAREVDAKYLLFLDDDVVVPNNSLRRFVHLMENNPEWDLVTGMVPLKDRLCEPCVFREGYPGPYWGWTFGEPFEIDSCGMAYCMIRVDAFEKVEQPWFKWTRKLNGQDVEEEGEDVGFCRRLKEAGGVLMGDGMCLCGHVGEGGRIFQLDVNTAPFRSERAQEALSHTTTLTHEEVPA